jgi:hypothetical protein
MEMKGESNLAVHIIIFTPPSHHVTNKNTLSTWGMENPIYQTINFVRIVTVILLNDLRMLLQHFELDFFHFSSFLASFFIFMSLLHYPSLIPWALWGYISFIISILFSSYFYSFDPKKRHHSLYRYRVFIEMRKRASSLFIILCNKKRVGWNKKKESEANKKSLFSLFFFWVFEKWKEEFGDQELFWEIFCGVFSAFW